METESELVVARDWGREDWGEHWQKDFFWEWGNVLELGSTDTCILNIQ